MLDESAIMPINHVPWMTPPNMPDPSVPKPALQTIPPLEPIPRLIQRRKHRRTNHPLLRRRRRR